MQCFLSVSAPVVVPAVEGGVALLLAQVVPAPALLLAPPRQLPFTAAAGEVGADKADYKRRHGQYCRAKHRVLYQNAGNYYKRQRIQSRF